MNKEKIEKLKYERYEELSKEELKDFECLISKYSKSLLAYNLIMEKQENQKYKEVIDKARDLIEKSVTTDIGIDSNNNIIRYHQLTEDETGELLDILKGVDND